MRIVCGESSRRVSEAPRHPEVNQKNPTALEPNDQILASSTDGGHPLALELRRDLSGLEGPDESWVEDLYAFEPAAGEGRFQAGADDFDLGQLRHEPSVAMAIFASARAT
jgi:hypothetical protein